MCRTRAIQVMVIAILTLAGHAATAASIAGRVMKVVDGDTVSIVVTATNDEMAVRLANIDAPKLGQPWSAQSKSALSELLFGKEVSLTVQQKDKNGLLVATIVTSDGMNVNSQQVKKGLAWANRKYQTSSTIPDDEEQARRLKLGVWSDSSPVEPAIWRQRAGLDKPVGSPSMVTRSPVVAKAKAPEVKAGISEEERMRFLMQVPNVGEGLTNEQGAGVGGGSSVSAGGGSGGAGGGRGQFYTGSRGGQYSITSGGNRNYGGRK